MSNGELLERLLDMVKFGWIARILHELSKCSNVAQISPKLHKIAEYCTSITQIAQNYPSAQGTPHPGYNSLNHCHHPTPYSQQKRAAYSAFTFSTPIILFFVASRSCLVSCQSDSVIVAICSLKSHRSRF